MDYSGRWYEIVRLPLFWQTKCEGSIAEYSFDKNGRLYITNTCLDSAGNVIAIDTGIGIPETDNIYRINFTGQPFWSDYIIEWTDFENYSIVSSSNKKYLWLLARQPKIPKSVLDDFIEWADKHKFDVSSLIIVPGSIKSDY